MAALTAYRPTPRRKAQDRAFTVKSGAIIYSGAQVALNAGELVPGGEATGLVAVGKASEGGVGGETVRVERGCFCWENAGDVTASDIGSPAYMVDDQTVSASHATNTRSEAGTIFDVDAEGVWVEV